MGGDNCAVLVLSTNTEILKSVSSFIDGLPYNITSAENCYDALEYSKTSNFKIAIIDSCTDEYSKFLYEIKKTAPALNIIVVCNELNLTNISETLHDQVDEFILHPVKQIDLKLAFKRIDKLIGLQMKLNETGKQIDCLKQKEFNSLVYDEKLISKDIKSTQQDYHQLFDAVPSYIAVLNRDKYITEINRRFKEDFGDQTGRSFFEVLNPGSIPADKEPISQVILTTEPHQGEIVLTSQNGKQYNMMAWAVPITTPTGNLQQILVVLADKTEMRNLKDNLSSLGLMIGTLSHNLKGSLTGLDAGLYLIDTGFYRNKDARIEEGLDVSKLMVDRIRKMIFNVLYYAKERELNLSNTNINQFAGDVAAHVENRILGGNISFSCDFPSKEINCMFDPELLRSALINILDNAREVCISDQSDKAYEIIFKVFIQNNDLVFEIYDNGSGMDKEQQEQLFSIFSSSKGLQGTGLGLYITHEVIRKHNGSINVTSTPGKGTCFSITIPTSLQQKNK